MVDVEPLSDLRAQAYVKALEARGRGPFAFVGLHPQEEKMEGIHGSLGLAVANERGYTPVPLAWARYASQDAASDHADHLNKLIGLDAEQATLIIISTMGGVRYVAPEKG